MLLCTCQTGPWPAADRVTCRKCKLPGAPEGARRSIAGSRVRQDLQRPKTAISVTMRPAGAALRQTSKSAELETLDCSRRRVMSVIAALNQLERRTEHLAERNAIVANHGQSAASVGTIRSERPSRSAPSRAREGNQEGERERRRPNQGRKAPHQCSSTMGPTTTCAEPWRLARPSIGQKSSSMIAAATGRYCRLVQRRIFPE
jgi:hypothetical protein